MEAFEQHDEDSARIPAVPTISLTQATPAKRKRTSDAPSVKTPSSSKRVEPVNPPASSKSHKAKSKSKDKAPAVGASSAAPPASVPAAPAPDAASSSAAGPSSTPASSLAFAAVALAQAKRDEDKRKKKERRSKSGAEEERSESPTSEKEKDRSGETKEERKKRKEEKRRRKEEKERKKAEKAEAEGGKERKHKHKDGDEHKKSKKHKRKASEIEEESTSPEVESKKAKTDTVATNFSAVVTNFMAAATSAATKRSAGHGEGEAARQAVVATSTDVNGSADAAAPSTPKTPKSKKDKKKDKAALAAQSTPAPLDEPIAVPSSPTPSHDPMEAPSSPEPDRDPMDASSSPEPDRGPMEASSSPASTASPPTATTALPAASPSKAPRTSTGRTAAEIAAAWSNSQAAASSSSSKAPAKAKAPAKPRKKKDEAEVDVDAEDEALRERLKDPNELNEFLSSRWIDIPVLQRLEKKGILTWKRGKYTEAERAAVRAHLDTFMTTHNMSDTDLVEIIFAKGRGSARSKYPGFWAEVAAQVPGRPLRYVKEAVQRMYHPNAHKGAWTKEEDEALQRAYTETPDQWVRIGDAVGRSYIDCRDRYKKQIEVAKERVSGRWSKTEEEQLKEAVKSATAELGKDMMSPDIPWPVVAKLMGGNRSFHQCRVKWQEHMVPMLRGAIYGASASSVLSAIRKLGYEHENDIVWREVGNEANSHVKSAQATWRRMLLAVAPVEGKTLSEILGLMDARIDELEDDISNKASATAARSERAKKAAARRALERERTESTRRERTQWVEAARSREPSWLEAAGAAVSQAEAWMDDVVASRAVSRSQDGLLTVGSDRSRSRSVSGGPRKVSFAADTQ